MILTTFLRREHFRTAKVSKSHLNRSRIGWGFGVKLTTPKLMLTPGCLRLFLAKETFIRKKFNLERFVFSFMLLLLYIFFFMVIWGWRFCMELKLYFLFKFFIYASRLLHDEADRWSTVPLWSSTERLGLVMLTQTYQERNVFKNESKRSSSSFKMHWIINMNYWWLMPDLLYLLCSVKFNFKLKFYVLNYI